MTHCSKTCILDSVASIAHSIASKRAGPRHDRNSLYFNGICMHRDSETEPDPIFAS